MLAKRDMAKLRYAKNNDHLNEANKQILYLFRLRLNVAGGRCRRGVCICSIAVFETAVFRGGAFVFLPSTWMMDVFSVDHFREKGTV